MNIEIRQEDFDIIEEYSKIPIAFDTPGVHRLEGRKDIAALWDIRVNPDYRGRGIGTLLFREAVEFARQRKCICLKSETQNTNVPACKFYRKHGCVLGAINRFAYWEIPNEAMLDWYFDLRE
ncbi:MAG: GNAT family N-acetyltransferase [Candidatus Hodarchaeota archaeon]